MDPVKLETARYATGDDHRFSVKVVGGVMPRTVNLVDVSFTNERGMEILLYDARGDAHRAIITPAAAANLIRRLAGYLATHHGGTE
jgi:hypothetical protein